MKKIKHALKHKPSNYLAISILIGLLVAHYYGVLSIENAKTYLVDLVAISAAVKALFHNPNSYKNEPSPEEESEE